MKKQELKEVLEQIQRTASNITFYRGCDSDIKYDAQDIVYKIQYILSNY